MPASIVGIIIVGAWICLSLAIGYVFSGIVLHSRRQPIVRTPGEYGLDFESVEFKATDGVLLQGWYIPAGKLPFTAEPKQVVILTHPMTFNRHGFVVENQGFPPIAKTAVDLLKTARALNAAGYPVLMFDFRNHGESEAGLSGVGLTEYQDVIGAIAYVNNRWLSAPAIGFVSFCMGANATTVALSKAKDQLRDIKFLIAVQPVSAEVFIRSYLRNVYTPLSLYLLPIIDRIVRWRGGFALKEMSPLRYARDVVIPTLVIQAREDPWTELTDTQAYYQALSGPKELWLIDGIQRRFETYNYVGDHPDRIVKFIRQHFSAG
ncbi:MAG: PhoPQ-activated protein PqaA family protein [Anaerolineales bacterium]|jgi:pimeloyl-ACP methyl ester carboxylesterase